MYKSSTERATAYTPYPDKLFYKIGEVSKIVGVEPYVLRYWETEFAFLKPRKNKSGQRVYTKKDVELLLDIKKLLHQERYTIEGVRKRLGLGPVNSKTKSEREIKKTDPLQTRQAIEHVKKRLREILSQLH